MPTIKLNINWDLWTFIKDMAADRAHYKGYTIDEMIQDKPVNDQILKWLEEIRQNKMRYKR